MTNPCSNLNKYSKPTKLENGSSTWICQICQIWLKCLSWKVQRGAIGNLNLKKDQFEISELEMLFLRYSRVRRFCRVSFFTSKIKKLLKRSAILSPLFEINWESCLRRLTILSDQSRSKQTASFFLQS